MTQVQQYLQVGTFEHLRVHGAEVGDLFSQRANHLLFQIVAQVSGRTEPATGEQMKQNKTGMVSSLGKARQGKAGQGKARQGEARPGKARPGKAR